MRTVKKINMAAVLMAVVPVLFTGLTIVAQRIAYGDFSVNGMGQTLTFGSLKLHGRSIEPVILHYDPNTILETSKPPVTVPDDEDRRQGEILRAKAMESFRQSRWEECIDLLNQALQKLPNDQALNQTLTSACCAQRYTEIAKAQAKERSERHSQITANDAAQLTEELNRLSDTIATLQKDVSEKLISQGQFEAAVSISGQPGFMIDSSVVDLRGMRQGVVNFDVLKSPIHHKSEPLRIRKAHRLLDNPAMQSVIFFERMGEIVGYDPDHVSQASTSPFPDKQPYSRYANPVMKAVAEHMGIRLERASPVQLAVIRKKTEAIWNAYDKSKSAQNLQNQQIAHQSLEMFGDTINNLEKEGLIRPGENLLEHERDNPEFGKLIHCEVSRIVMHELMARREVDRRSFDQLLSDVSGILRSRGKR